jgi:hypothetical protein
VAEDVLDLDGGVEGEIRPLGMEGGGDAQGMGGAVEEVRIAEADVAGAGRNLAADVGEDDMERDHAKGALVEGDDGAMAAEVLAAATGLGGASGEPLAVDDERGVAVKRGQGGAVRREEGEAGERDEIGGRAAFDDVEKGLFEFAAKDGGNAELTEKLRVEWGVEAVGNEGGTRVEFACPENEGNGRAGGRMHGQVKGLEIGVTEGFGRERGDGSAGGDDVVASGAQPGGGGGQAEGLAAEVIG